MPGEMAGGVLNSLQGGAGIQEGVLEEIILLLCPVDVWKLGR